MQMHSRAWTIVKSIWASWIFVGGQGERAMNLPWKRSGKGRGENGYFELHTEELNCITSDWDLTVPLYSFEQETYIKGNDIKKIFNCRSEDNTIFKD